MNLGEAARAAAREIRIHKLRSLLSFSAISVGAASLLYTLAQTRGMQQAVSRNLELMGPGALAIEHKRDYVSRGLSKGLTVDDAQALRAQMPALFMVSPTAQSWNADLTYEGRRVESTSVVGVTPEWRRRNWVYTQRGRFFSERDQREAARVCIVIEPGGWFKKPFWASFWNWEPGFDKIVSRPDLLVPLATFSRFLGSRRGNTPGAVDEISIDTGDEKTLGPSRRRIETILKQRHRGEEDFEVKNQRQELEDSIREENKYVLVALILGVVALISGGIGILNVTLAAVYSRVREIGIRRALGAERSDVMALFMAEAALLGLAGGVAGVVLGVIGIEKLAKAADRDVVDMAWYHAVAMVALSSAVAAAFSAYPAWLASRLDPVEALREEL